MHSKGKIFVVGLGALTKESITYQAMEVLENSDFVVGYTTYVNRIEKILPHLRYIKTGMKKEVERIQKAVQLARDGYQVSVICSGDAGIYAMAGLVFEVLEKQCLELPVEVIPGVPALAICAAVLGAPLMNDFSVISFSNLLTPEDVIQKRLNAFLDADVVLVIYNPISKGRKALFERLWSEVVKKRSECWSGYVKNGGRENQHLITRVCNLPLEEIDMNTLIIVGNSFTDNINGRLVTRRGYKLVLLEKLKAEEV
ncbi:MAG: precorrin-3B C(17)-methyltransferase [bacterium]